MQCYISDTIRLGKRYCKWEEREAFGVIDAVMPHLPSFLGLTSMGSFADYNTELIRQNITTNQLFLPQDIEIHKTGTGTMNY